VTTTSLDDAMRAITRFSQLLNLRVFQQNRRRARLHGRPREGAESERKPAFPCEREIEFAAQLRRPRPRSGMSAQRPLAPVGGAARRQALRRSGDRKITQRRILCRGRDCRNVYPFRISGANRLRELCLTFPSTDGRQGTGPGQYDRA
jgi:hypothetical protein